MRTFKEWSGEQVFSTTPETKSHLIYSDERKKYFWIVHARNWEEIHRSAGWWSVVLRDRTEAANLLGGTTRVDFSTKDKAIMERLKKCDPDMENSDPDTRMYVNAEGALANLTSNF